MAQSAGYIWGTSLTEQQRLLKQIELYVPAARWLLQQVDIQSGWRVIDVGCGPLGILDLLAERVGPQGEVIGLELEPHLVEMANALVAERHLTNVQVVQGDASATGLPPESFDLAHERLLLIVVPDPERVVAELIQLVRPGGVILLEDVDAYTWICEPLHPAWTRLFAAFATIYQMNGASLYIGRRLAGLLRSAGLVDVRVNVHAQVNGPGDFHQHQLQLFTKLFWEKILAHELLSAAELTDLFDQLQAHLTDPETLVISPILFQAWGRKPG